MLLEKNLIRGKAKISIEDNTESIHMSIPLELLELHYKVKGRYFYVGLYQS